MVLWEFEPCGSFRGPLCLLPRHFRSPFISLHYTLFHSYWLQDWGERGRRSGGGVLLGFWGNLEERLCPWISSRWHRALPGGPTGFCEPKQASGEVSQVTVSVRPCSCFTNLLLAWLVWYLPTFAWAHPKGTFIWDSSPENCKGTFCIRLTSVVVLFDVSV